MFGISKRKQYYLFEVLEKAKGFGFKAGTLTAIEEFVTMIKYFQNQLTKHNAYDVAVQVGKHTNIVKELLMIIPPKDWHDTKTFKNY
jgi:DNA helicase-2/ATP-dependent DNA helicase PcrA